MRRVPPRLPPTTSADEQDAPSALLNTKLSRCS
eukprot:SAG22_NODE_6132_length_895_cov_0.795226_1_plen_32_part_10